MGKYSLITFTWILIVVHLSWAQDKYNFIVPPTSTNCDSLFIDHVDVEFAMQLIANTVFRFQQSVSINREKGFKEASFFSCDNQNGYMVIKYHNLIYLYAQMPKLLWEGMIKSGNPGDYFERNIRNEYACWLSKEI